MTYTVRIPRTNEDVLKKSIIYSLVKNGIDENRHGFSRNSNLLMYTHFMIEAFEVKCDMGSVYWDFPEAFDRKYSLLLLK